MKYVLYLKYNMQLKNAYNITDGLQRKYQLSTNYCRYIEICNQKANIASIVNPLEVATLEKEVEETMKLNTSVIDSLFLANNYYVLGMRHFAGKQYKTAVTYLQLSLDYGNERRKKDINVYLMYLRQLTKIDTPLQYFDNTIESSTNNIMDMCYEYFVRKKNGEDDTVLEKYIMKEILPKITHYDKFIILVFEQELLLLIKQTRKHKDIAIFREVIAKTEEKIA